jgi:sulfite exporter TauE/SafE
VSLPQDAMHAELLVLATTAAAIGFVHTLLGPDHYVPFIVLATARGWSRAKTSAITLLCGAGHVLSSIVLAVVGLALGVAVSRLTAIETTRGRLASWALIAIGLLYGAWGLRKALAGAHGHVHLGGGHAAMHALTHAQAHGPEHAAAAARRVPLGPWALFIVFVLGPCEPLIPLLLYPAATSSLAGTVVVIGVFAATTIGTMLGLVLLGAAGVRHVHVGVLERYSHALAGAAILACGLAIRFFGL